MRYAIISDLHSNKRAFESVLDDIDRSQIDMVLCLGDLVGYGPSPVEVMDMAYEHIDVSILGNHDAVVCNKFSPAYFNPRAREIIEWTRSMLRDKDIEYFNKQAYLIDSDHFKCTHANFYFPDNFGYILSSDDATQNFKEVEESLMFVGHTHVPGTFVLSKDDTVSRIERSERDLIKLEDDKRYIVNVGSVGVARGSAFKSSYCIYDSEDETVLFRTVEFDVRAFAEDVYRTAKKEIVQYFTPLIGDLSE